MSPMRDERTTCKDIATQLLIREPLSFAILTIKADFHLSTIKPFFQKRPFFAQLGQFLYFQNAFVVGRVKMDELRGCEREVSD